MGQRKNLFICFGWICHYSTDVDIIDSELKRTKLANDVLKIKEDTEVYRNAEELAEKVPIGQDSEWISVMKIIANASLGYTFSKSQLSDFLTLAAKGIEQKKTSSEIIIFKMYRDIIDNCDNFTDSLKSNYPEIIVDVIYVINQGMDTKGNKVSIIGLDQ